MLVVDADASGQDIVDLAHLGHSLAVTTAPGTDQLGTAANIAAALIHQGKSVLVVGENAQPSLTSLASWSAPTSATSPLIC